MLGRGGRFAAQRHGYTKDLSLVGHLYSREDTGAKISEGSNKHEPLRTKVCQGGFLQQLTGADTETQS